MENLEAIKQRILNEWRVVKRAESKERIAIALDKFITLLLNNELTS